jgi:fructose-1,6-bisphosphatase/inositol monophosphatase family enzyme
VCISLALCVYKMPVVGVIYNPVCPHSSTCIPRLIC